MRHAILIVLAAPPCHAQLSQLSFVDATAQAGLADISTGRVCFADLDADGRPDAILDRRRVFLNVEGDDGVRFEEVAETGLPELAGGDCLVFADLDNDGLADAILTRNIDANEEEGERPRTAWFKGEGDGTFGEARPIEAAPPKTTAAVAIGDVNLDGLLDLYLGNWYVRYGEGYEGFANDLLLQREGGDFERVVTPADEATFDETSDAAGRPTYGVMIANLVGDERPELLDLNYGRRWNRLWRVEGDGSVSLTDVAPSLGLDGDAIRHGRHPDWLLERAKTDPRFDRPDEKPFRANGNSFDAAVGDVDGDGDFDLFVSEITHGWAGESSDRSRFLVRSRDERGETTFVEPAELDVDRAPADPTIKSWNQGDLFCELADFDLDGRLDLLLSSGDYPDDQRLRLYRQQEDGSFADVTPWVGLANDGSQQVSLADVDLDGDLDILVGQTFFRLNAARKAGRTPSAKLYLNQAVERSLGAALTLHLVGDPALGVSRDALGAIVEATMTVDGKPVTLVRQLIGAGGHAGKQHEFIVHFGLGEAEVVDRLEITWPGASHRTSTVEDVGAGRYEAQITSEGVTLEAR